MGDGFFIHPFACHDDWHAASDEMRASLELQISAATSDLNLRRTAESWRASGQMGRTLGRDSTVAGDSNPKGIARSSDLVLVFQSGEYEDDVLLNSTFEEADRNGDGDFTTRGLVFAFPIGNDVAAA